MKRYVFLLIALPLAGCHAGQQEQQLAKCVFDAESNNPAETWLAGGERQTYVWLCMAAHGYTLNRGQGACERSAYAPDAALYAQCYEPRARASALLYKMEKVR